MPKQPKGRREPLTAAYAPNPNNAVRSKPILLYSGRGYSRLTADEARRLREDLLAAIFAYEEDMAELAHAKHVADGTAHPSDEEDPTEVIECP